MIVLFVPHLHIIVIKANDSQGFSHHLPVTAIVDGAHFRAVTLWETSES